jgi:hypothetical protein
MRHHPVAGPQPRWNGFIETQHDLANINVRHRKPLHHLKQIGHLISCRQDGTEIAEADDAAAVFEWDAEVLGGGWIAEALP